MNRDDEAMKVRTWANHVTGEAVMDEPTPKEAGTLLASYYYAVSDNLVRKAEQKIAEAFGAKTIVRNGTGEMLINVSAVQLEDAYESVGAKVDPREFERYYTIHQKEVAPDKLPEKIEAELEKIFGEFDISMHQPQLGR